jgi:TPR repeat protein
MARKEWNRLMAKAQKGDSEAQWAVGSWLEDGLVDSAGRILARPDFRAAVRWYRKSAVAANASGQICLGVCLCDGRGVRRDDVEGLRWFKRALRQGDTCAPNNIARVYQDRGNYRRAMFWYRHAVACGDGDALVELGRGYYGGIGARRNPKQAVRLFRRAIISRNITQAGREDAMFRLGLAFYEGRGVKRSGVRAIQWLRQANRDDDHIEARALIERIAQKRR